MDRASYLKAGTITAGNASGLKSAASALIVADATWAAKHGLEPVPAVQRSVQRCCEARARPKAKRPSEGSNRPWTR